MKNWHQIKSEREYKDSLRMNSKQLVLFFKGVANPFRVSILMLMDRSTKLTVEQIHTKVGGSYKTIAVHLGKMERGGLLQKKYCGVSVEHSITHEGKELALLIRTSLSKKHLF